jgi:hypothetical protein
METRNLYIPLTPNYHATTSSTESPNATGHLPENMPLRLPSTLPVSFQKSCPFGLDRIELRFRLAQAEDSLTELRRLLRITMSLRNYKSKQIGPSQRAGTRALNLINRFTDKVSRCVERYRATHTALLALDPNGEWQMCLHPLEKEDIWAPGRGDNESEGYRNISWIWLDTSRYRQGQPEVPSPQSPEPSEPGPLSDEELDGCEHMN